MPQLNSILAGSLDKKLTMTDTERCIAVKTLEGKLKEIQCVKLYTRPCTKCFNRIAGLQYHVLLTVNAYSSAYTHAVNIGLSIVVVVVAGHQKSVTCCAWSGMYKMAISGSADKQVMLWNPFSCRPMGTLTGHAAGIVAMTLNERDHQIITAAEDKTIKVGVMAS